MKNGKALFFGLSAILTMLVFAPMPALANHSWGGYHWARTANPFNLKLGDNVLPSWDSYLTTTSSDWSQSAVLDTTIVPGSTTARKCRPAQGRVEVCNNKYGFNGWLGVATVWINGSHIYQGTVKVNDSYFNNATYNTPAWRNMVMCQEVGHTLGLDHQDTDFSNAPLGTCMDYTADPAANQHPNQHDYDQLAEIYAHLDSTTTVNQVQQQGASRANAPEPQSWGQLVRKHGKNALYVQDLGKGHKIFTFVILK
ncbi:hypothetical protein HYU82_02990 [Candidatus Saccharibacteria bacterium]|nr:hypothetical protein [Candidatus Saccharibacteria bacterium]